MNIEMTGAAQVECVLARSLLVAMAASVVWVWLQSQRSCRGDLSYLAAARTAMAVQRPRSISSTPRDPNIRFEEYSIEETLINVRRKRVVSAYGRVGNVAPDAKRVLLRLRHLGYSVTSTTFSHQNSHVVKRCKGRAWPELVLQSRSW